jgi:hypothetical protein
MVTPPGNRVLRLPGAGIMQWHYPSGSALSIKVLILSAGPVMPGARRAEWRDVRQAEVDPAGAPPGVCRGGGAVGRGVGRRVFRTGTAGPCDGATGDLLGRWPGSGR